MRNELAPLLKAKGASLVGFAPLSALPDGVRQGFPTGISIGVALDPAVVRGIPTGPHLDYQQEYDDVNALLDQLGLFAEGWLRARGENALAITVERAVYDANICRTTLPHKTVARLAGHGWIGRCALLISPEYGSAVRYTTVLTSAAIKVGDPVLTPQCGSCDRCVQACPGGAISGKLWAEGVDRDELVSTSACRAVFQKRGQISGQRDGTCGLCIAACPYTLKYIS